MIVWLFLALFTPSADARDVCEAASMVFKDMRYIGGGYADPGDFTNPKVKDRLANCEKVARLAVPHGTDVALVSVAVAYNETNFRPNVRGSSGEVGMMQVRAKYHCKPYPDLNDGKGGCTNPERAGVRYLRFLLDELPVEQALRRYNGSRAYARKVGGLYRAAKQSYRRQQEALAERG